MVNVQLGPAEILTVIGFATVLAVTSFQIALYIGKLTGRVDRHDDELKGVDKRLENHDDELRYLKGIKGIR